MKLTHIFVISLMATIGIYTFLRQSHELSFSLIGLSGMLGGMVCFILFMIRERKVLREMKNKVPLENLFGLAILSLFIGFTVLTIPLVIEFIIQ